MIRLLALLALSVPVIVVVACHMDAHSETPQCMDAETRELARGLMIEGLNTALKAHTTRLFDVWLKDASAQPDRAAVGMRNAVAAFERSRTDVMNWNPPACKGDKR